MDILLSPLLPIVTIVMSLILGAGYLRWRKTDTKTTSTSRTADATTRGEAAGRIAGAENGRTETLRDLQIRAELAKAAIGDQTDEEALAALEKRYKDKVP